MSTIRGFECRSICKANIDWSRTECERHFSQRFSADCYKLFIQSSAYQALAEVSQLAQLAFDENIDEDILADCDQFMPTPCNFDRLISKDNTIHIHKKKSKGIGNYYLRRPQNHQAWKTKSEKMNENKGYEKSSQEKPPNSYLHDSIVRTTSSLNFIFSHSVCWSQHRYSTIE